MRCDEAIRYVAEFDCSHLQIVNEYKTLPDNYNSLSDKEKNQFIQLQNSQISKVKSRMAKYVNGNMFIVNYLLATNRYSLHFSILTQIAYRKGSSDNISVVIVWLQ